MDPFKIIKNPIATEKAVKLMETENKLIFVVSRDSSKSQIKQAIEKVFGVKVIKVNTYISNKGIKKAYVLLSKDSQAIDVATKLGLM